MPAGGTRTVERGSGLRLSRRSIGLSIRWHVGLGLVRLSRMLGLTSRSGGCGSNDFRTRPPTWCTRVAPQSSPLPMNAAARGIG